MPWRDLDGLSGVEAAMTNGELTRAPYVNAVTLFLAFQRVVNMMRARDCAGLDELVNTD
jgi:hypothetical protein